MSAVSEPQTAAREAAGDATAVRLAIVGAGKMGAAVLQGAIEAEALTHQEIGIYHPNPRRLEELASRYGVVTLDDEGLHRAERVLLSVKPQSFDTVAPLVARRNASFVSIMAGVTAETIAKRVGSRRVIRAMPNLGARVGVSATALAYLPEATPEDRAMALTLFSAVGRVYEVPESQFDAFTGLAGSGPAFAAVVAEALADGGVRVGIDRATAQDLARQVLLATARLLERQRPSELKDEVASPGGTGIAGVRALERDGLRFAVIDAVEQASERARALSGEDG